jgi:HSP20 family molecular chaperone IbpA
MKLLIPLLSALAGAGLMLTLGRANPQWFSNSAKAQSQAHKSELDQDDLFKKLHQQQTEMQKDLDHFFNDDFFKQSDPFESMRRFREEMQKKMQGLDHFRAPTQPFDNWFADRFGGGTVDDIRQWEDAQFIYYEIELKDLDQSQIQTKVERGHITIEGTTKRQLHSSSGSHAESHGVFQSHFSRTLPLPAEVDADKMESSYQDNKLTLKFPKIIL